MSMSSDPPDEAAALAARKAQRHTETRQRPHMWHMRVSDAEHEKVEASYDAYLESAQAQDYGASRAGFMRWCCLGKAAQPLHARRVEDDPVFDHLIRLRGEVNSIGVNVNQMARAVNRNRVPLPGEIAGLQEALTRMEARIDAELSRSVANDHDGRSALDDRQG